MDILRYLILYFNYYSIYLIFQSVICLFFQKFASTRYRFQKVEGNITGVEEIPVIITEYGLIAQVKSFSPFKIVQIKKSSDAVTMSDAKNVYATVNGVGGTVSAQENSGKGGITSVTEDKVTYYINAQEHYQVGTVLLNGKAISLSRIKDGKLTLDKDELSFYFTLLRVNIVFGIPLKLKKLFAPFF